jgi:serine O-acetyltransferase
MSFYEKLVYARKNPLFGRLAYLILKLLGIEIPQSVKIGKGLLIHHGGVGIVVHPNTTLGENVSIYPGVTLGRADVHHSADRSNFTQIIVEDNVILGSGSKILGNQGTLRVAAGTVVGANAVLLNSTAQNEIWAGIPAKNIGMRD